jgi:hypothetical protein
MVSPKRNKPWTAEDDRRLLELRAAGRSTISISATPKRSQSAVEDRLYILRKRTTATA